MLSWIFDTTLVVTPEAFVISDFVSMNLRRGFPPAPERQGACGINCGSISESTRILQRAQDLCSAGRDTKVVAPSRTAAWATKGQLRSRFPGSIPFGKSRVSKMLCLIAKSCISLNLATLIIEKWLQED